MLFKGMVSLCLEDAVLVGESPNPEGARRMWAATVDRVCSSNRGPFHPQSKMGTENDFIDKGLY